MSLLHEAKSKKLWKLTDDNITEGELPEDMREPWALMIVDHDGEWSGDFQERFVENCIKLGGRYFLISGAAAEDWQECIDEIATTMAPEENIIAHVSESGEVDEAVEHFLNHAKEQSEMNDLGVVFLDLGDTDEDEYTDLLTSMMD